MAYSFCFFLCSWILFACLYFKNNCSIPFFILFSAKYSLLFMINSISCFKVLLTYFCLSEVCILGFWDLLSQSYFISLLYFLSLLYWLIKFLQNFLVILLCWYKRYSISLISFFNLYELFPDFNCVNNIGSLVKSLLRVKILILFFILLFLHHLLVVAC